MVGALGMGGTGRMGGTLGNFQYPDVLGCSGVKVRFWTLVRTGLLQNQTLSSVRSSVSGLNQTSGPVQGSGWSGRFKPGLNLPARNILSHCQLIRIIEFILKFLTAYFTHCFALLIRWLILEFKSWLMPLLHSSLTTIMFIALIDGFNFVAYGKCDFVYFFLLTRTCSFPSLFLGTMVILAWQQLCMPTLPSSP